MQWLRSHLKTLALGSALLTGIVLGSMLFGPVLAQQVANSPIAYPSAQLLATATAVANSVATATLAPSAGQWTYITALEVSACGDATGDAAAATPTTFTFAGFTTNAIIKIDSLHTAGVCIARVYNFPNPIKSATTGSAVAQTITSSNITHLIPSINIYGFYSSTSY